LASRRRSQSGFTPLRSAEPSKQPLFVAVLGGFVLVIYAPDYTLAAIGAPELLLLAAVSWVGGFVLAPLPLGLFRLGKLAVRR
jgi:hypothetical protein